MTQGRLAFFAEGHETESYETDDGESKRVDKVKWGIIGVGDVTEVKSGPALSKVDGSELVAVMRRTPHLAEDYAARHGVARWYTDAQDLIDDAEVNAIYIATPPESHHRYTLAAARVGKPIYVEKPMAMRYTQCLDMVAAAKAAGVPLFVAYYRRTLPRFVKIREIVQSGEIGDVLAVTTRFFQPMSADVLSDVKPWRVVPAVAGGGILFDLASHILDYLDFLFGPVRDVFGHAGNQGRAYEAEDIVAGSYRFENGVHGTGMWCFTSGTELDENEIVGTRGRVKFATFANEPIVVTTAGGEDRIYIDTPDHVQQPLIQTIVDELLGRGGTCPSTGETAARTSWVLDELVKSYYG